MQHEAKMFYTMIKKLDSHTYLENYLLYHLSPVITGVKPAVTLSINTQKELHSAWQEIGLQLVESFGLRARLLRDAKTSIVLYIYDPLYIDEILQDADILAFLQKFDYPTSYSLESMIDTLVKRYGIYNCPHELGIFLGFPLDDVMDFIHCTNKPCKLCGYWQVYNDLDTAKATFASYDKAKSDMLYYLLEDLQKIS